MRIQGASALFIVTVHAAAVWSQSGQVPVRDAGPVEAIGTARLAGVVVVDEPVKLPLRRAIVILSGTGIKGTRQLITDDRGQFAFAGLVAGRFTITAEQPPFVKAYFGSPRPGRGPGTPIALVDREQKSITIALQRGVVLSGTVTDESRTPIGSSQIHALQPVTADGRRKLVEAPFPYEYGVTDERGRYRIYGLPAGQYAIIASGGRLGGDVREITQAELDAADREMRSPISSPLGQPVTDRPAPIDAPSITRLSAYWPGSTDPDAAQVIALRPGEEREGLDIVTPTARAARIDGLSLGPDGQPLEGAMIGVANVSTKAVYASPGLVRPGVDGRFSLDSLAPATYLFYARGSTTPGPATMGPTLSLWAEVEVPLNGQDVSGVVLQFAPGRTVTGRLDFGGRPVPDLTGRAVALRPFPSIAGTNMPVPAGKLAPDGTFVFSGVAPGTYRARVQGIEGWSLRSAMFNGRDTLDAPLEVPRGDDIRDLTLVMTDRPTEVSGTVFDQLGRPTPEYAVFVFAADRTFWTSAPRRQSGAVKPDSAGKFAIRDLPAGEYYIAVVIDADPADLNEPSFIEQLIPSSIRIVLGEGERKTQDLRLGG